MNIINFVEKNAAPIGAISIAVIFGAAAICTHKAMTKIEKINNEPEEKVENDSEVEEKNETVEKTKALIPMFGIIALSVVLAKMLSNEHIMLASLTGFCSGLAYSVNHTEIDTVTKNFRLVCAGTIGVGIIGYLFAMRLK